MPSCASWSEGQDPQGKWPGPDRRRLRRRPPGARPASRSRPRRGPLRAALRSRLRAFATPSASPSASGVRRALTGGGRQLPDGAGEWFACSIRHSSSAPPGRLTDVPLFWSPFRSCRSAGARSGRHLAGLRPVRQHTVARSGPSRAPSRTSGSAPTGEVEQVRLYIAEVPADVRCVRITAEGAGPHGRAGAGGHRRHHADREPVRAAHRHRHLHWRGLHRRLHHRHQEHHRRLGQRPGSGLDRAGPPEPPSSW